MEVPLSLPPQSPKLGQITPFTHKKAAIIYLFFEELPFYGGEDTKKVLNEAIGEFSKVQIIHFHICLDIDTSEQT